MLRLAGEPLKWVKYHGGAMSKAGTPDLHVTYHGQSLWLELKVNDNQPTAQQVQEMLEWESAGAISRVVRTLDDVDELLRPIRLAALSRRQTVVS